jgi:hypothetical protein
MTYQTSHTMPPTTTTTPATTAAIAFISGLVGLLFANIVLGPTAIGLGTTALRRGTTHRGRAILGIALGVADLVVFAVLAVHSAAHGGHLTWPFGTF